MIIEITILTAPIAVSVEQTTPIMAEIGGIGTLIVNNYYSEGGAGGYTLTEADKEAIATLARYDDTEIRNLIAQIQGYDDTEIRQLIAQIQTYDDTEIRNLIAQIQGYDDTEIRNLIAQIQGYDDTEIRALIDQRAQELGDYIGQNLSAFAQQISETDQRSRQNASAIQSINTAMLQIPEIEETAAQNSQSISTINGTIGDIATILDALNGEVI